MLKLYLDSIIIWLSPNSMLPLRPVNFWVVSFRLGYITEYEFSFVNHAPFNHKAAGWPSSAFYCFTKSFSFVSKPVLILLFTLYLLRLFYIINCLFFLLLKSSHEEFFLSSQYHGLFLCLVLNYLIVCCHSFHICQFQVVFMNE